MDNIESIFEYKDEKYISTAENVMQTISDIYEEEGIESEDGTAIWVDFPLQDLKTLVDYTRALEENKDD